MCVCVCVCVCTHSDAYWTKERLKRNISWV